MKTTKYSNIPDVENQYESDGQTIADLEHTEGEKDALIKNQMAVTAFTMAFPNNEYQQYCMDMVLDSKTTEWPSRQAWTIISELQEEYALTNLMRDAEQQRELESIQMKRNVNPKELFSQITTIENKYRGRNSALIEKNKLNNIILRAPDKYAQTIHTAPQLIKAEIHPRELAVKELRTAMYVSTIGQEDLQEVGTNTTMRCLSILYTEDDSDGNG